MRRRDALVIVLESFRQFGRRGGRKAAAMFTAEQRSERARHAAAARWTRVRVVQPRGATTHE